MAYYAALVSAVQLFKELSHSEHQYPKSLFGKQQITSLYETLSHLQELLEDYSPTDKEATDFLERIRDAACRAQDLIECHITDAACRAREITNFRIPNAARLEREIIEFHIPDAAYQAKCIIESQIADQLRQPNCLEEIIHIAFWHFVSACHNSKHVNEEVSTVREGYQESLKLTKQLGSIVTKGYQELVKLSEEVNFINMGKGYPDLVKLKEEVDSIVIKRYQDLVKLKEELDAIMGMGHQDLERVKEVVDSIVGRGHQDLERVKEEVDSIVGRGYKHLLETIKEEVDSILGRRYQELERMKEEVDSIVRRGYQDWEGVKEKFDFIVIKGYKDLENLKKKLDAIGEKGYQDLEGVKRVVDSIVGKGYQDLERVKEQADSIVGKGYKDLLELVKVDVDSIVEDLTRIKESHTTHQDDLQVSAGASTQGPSDGRGMVGFKTHLTEIKSQLCGESSKLEVISIVGMGGIGKSTLARNIFNDILIGKHFDLRVWVTVSQSYHLRNILLAIVNSLNINKDELHGVEEGILKKRIYQHLFGRRYLIIMDDVWDTKILDDIKWIFPNDQSRSRIIITTRQSNVASIASASDFINHIPALEYDESWDLFCEKMFCPPELEDIGRSIVKNCRGLPLAIVVVAGLLSKVNKTKDDWEEIARGVGSTAARNDEHFSKILSLSYNYLPHHLKPCFLYLGGFPEDHEISVSKLVKLWVAEGFLKPIASKSLEEVAEEYLDELVKRNLVLITKRRSNGKFRCCNIHDLLRDMCSERAHHEHFLILQHKHFATGHIHRFFIHPDSSSNIYMERNKIQHVRSILSFGDTQIQFASHPSSFKPLRVLDAPNIKFYYFPAEVSELLHLRYLVHLHRQFRFPSLIFKLQNLQTLIADGFVSLPSEIWKMPQLRHVMIDKVRLPPIPLGVRIIGGVPLLGMLQTLYTVVDFTFTCSAVKMIPNLKKLKLMPHDCTTYENYWAKYGLKNLVDLHQLDTLDIDFLEGFSPDEEEKEVIHYPRSFSFPVNLKKLSLSGCILPWKDMTTVGSLPNLQVLKLRWKSFVGREWEPIEGEFPKLKFLLIERLYDLEYWGAENTHFPSLEQLHIRYCRKLEIPTGVGDISTLQLIELRFCSSFVESRAQEIQEEQREVGNCDLHVRCIRH